MSDGRKRLSGAEYKKRALQNAEKQRCIVEKTIKIDSFLKKSKIVNEQDNADCGCDVSVNQPAVDNFKNLKEDFPRAKDFPDTDLNVTNFSALAEK